MCTPRRRSMAMLSTTAGCSHISVCIAGQITTGARVASSVLVSRSVDRPVRVGGDDPRRRRGDDDQVGRLPELGVRDRGGRVVDQSSVCTGSLASALERGAADELLGARGHHRHDVGAGVDEPAATPRRPCRRRCRRSRRGRCACRRVRSTCDGSVSRRSGVVGIGDEEPSPAASAIACASASGSNSGSTGASVHTILSAAISSNPMRQRLAGDRRHLRRDHVAEAVTELVEVGVDVAGPAGSERDQAELRVDRPEQALDRRVDHRVVVHGAIVRRAAYLVTRCRFR